MISKSNVRLRSVRWCYGLLVSVISLGPRLGWCVRPTLKNIAKPAEKISKLRRRIATPWGQSTPVSCSLASRYRERSLIPFRRFLLLYKERNVSFTYKYSNETRSENISDGSFLSLLSFKYLQEKKWQFNLCQISRKNNFWSPVCKNYSYFIL